MKVTLLGPVSAETGGAEVHLGGLKQRAVFALLALHAGRVVSLDRLVDELWRDEPPSRATLSLQSYMSRLRRLLSGAAQIHTRPPGWTIDLDPDDVDVTRFVSLVSRARKLPPAEAVPVLRSALALWQGEALADLQTIAFARDEATRLGELRLSATGLLLDAMLALGQSDDVVAEARQFVAANPYHEHGWQSLMLALYRAGRQSEAVAAAAELRRLLVDDLGLDPSPETRELEQRILRQDPVLAPVIRGPDAPVTKAVVGRADALAQLDAAADGRGGLLVFDAPAGLGKSTMLQALADRMHAAGGVVVRGSGVGAGAMPALWPWVTIVRELAAHLPAESGPGTPAAAALAILNEGAGDAAMSRTTLYRGVVDLLGVVAAARPLAVLLDDAHWVDADTRTLLALAVDELAGKGVVFAVAVRSDEPGAAEVHDLVARTRRDLVTVVPLRGLDSAAVGEMVRGLSGADVGPAVIEAITHRTVGNPLFVGELVRLLSSERRLDAANVNAALPEHVRDVLRRRLDRLPGQTVALLTVVALAGGPADVDLLAAVTGLDADTVLDSCESALLAELLVEDPGGFVLSHDLVRQTLEADLSGARRVRLHAKLATALQARDGLTPQGVLDLARHLRTAAPIVGPAAAVPYLLAASDDALSRYAHDQGEQLLDDALQQISAIRDPAERTALAAQVRGKLATVRTWTRGVLAPPATHDVGPPPIDPEGAAGWVGNLVMTSVGGCYGWAAAIAEQALTEDLPPVGRMAAHFVAAWANFPMGRIDVSDDHWRAFEELMTLDPPVRLGGAISTVEVSAAGYASLIAHVRGDEAAADRALLLAGDRARERGEPNQINVELHHAWIAAMRGDAETARIHASNCIVLSDRFAYPAFRQHAAILAGWADAMLGDRDGPARIDAAFAAYRESGIRLFEPMYLLLRAEVHGSASLVDQAQAASAELGDVCLSPRLLAMSSALQRTRKP